MNGFYGDAELERFEEPLYALARDAVMNAYVQKNDKDGNYDICSYCLGKSRGKSRVHKDECLVSVIEKYIEDYDKRNKGD